MNLKRGFSRLTLAFSGTVMILSVGTDVWTMPPPPTTVRVTLMDGRPVALDHMPTANSRVTEREALAFAISELARVPSGHPDPHSQIVGKMKIRDAPPGFRPLPVQPEDIKEVTVGPSRADTVVVVVVGTCQSLSSVGRTRRGHVEHILHCPVGNERVHELINLSAGPTRGSQGK